MRSGTTIGAPLAGHGTTRQRSPNTSSTTSAVTDGTLAGALYFISPLSLPYVLERLTPLLEVAVAGKAAMKVVRSSP